jgi:hypothetical protein
LRRKKIYAQGKMRRLGIRGSLFAFHKAALLRREEERLRPGGRHDAYLLIPGAFAVQILEQGGFR